MKYTIKLLSKEVCKSVELDSSAETLLNTDQNSLSVSDLHQAMVDYFPGDLDFNNLGSQDSDVVAEILIEFFGDGLPPNPELFTEVFFNRILVNNTQLYSNLLHYFHVNTHLFEPGFTSQVPLELFELIGGSLLVLSATDVPIDLSNYSHFFSFLVSFETNNLITLREFHESSVVGEIESGHNNLTQVIDNSVLLVQQDLDHAITELDVHISGNNDNFSTFSFGDLYTSFLNNGTYLLLGTGGIAFGIYYLPSMVFFSRDIVSLIPDSLPLIRPEPIEVVPSLLLVSLYNTVDSIVLSIPWEIGLTWIGFL